MRIREFRLDDYSIVFELWKTAGLEIRPGDQLEDVKLKVRRDPDLFLVAEEGEQIIGAVMGAWDGRRGWIYHLAISPDHQRKGIGASLLNTLEKRLAAKGALRVNAQVQSSNKKSLEFFKASGYELRPDLVMIGKMLRGSSGPRDRPPARMYKSGRIQSSVRIRSNVLSEMWRPTA